MFDLYKPHDAAIKSATTQYSEFANEAEHDAYSDDDSFDALTNVKSPVSKAPEPEQIADGQTRGWFRK